MKFLQRLKQGTAHNIALVWCSALMAIGTVFYAIEAGCQVMIMNRSAEESTRQVDRLTESTNKAISRAVEASSKAITESITQNRTSIDAALKENKQAIESSERQSSLALESSIETFRNDQRAWIGVEIIEAHPPTINVGDPAYITFAFKNTGKTPARNVRATITKDPVQTGIRPDFTYARERTARYGILPPNGSAHVTLSVANSISTGDLRPIIPPILTALVNGTIIYYIHGFVLYGDIFDREHWMTICYFARSFPGPISFGACGEHNDTGDGTDPSYAPITGIEWPPKGG